MFRLQRREPHISTPQQPDPPRRPEAFQSRPASRAWDGKGAFVSIYARGFAFWVDKILLGLILLPLTGTFPMNEHLHNELITTAAFGVYRVICEYFWGRSLGKAIMSLRVHYSDKHGQERRGWNRLLFVLLRNSWLLAAGLVWFWSPGAEVGGITFLLFLSMFFSRDRATLMDTLAKARVLDTKISNTGKNAF